MKTLSFFLLGWLLLAGPLGSHAQGRYLTKTGHIDFFSGSPIEDIEANNNKVAAVLDLATGQLAFSVPIREFQFKRTLMQEHFNENYLESEKYPKATFTGHFSGADAAALGGPGAHPVQVEGDLTMHGVTRHISVPGTLELKTGQLLANATFNVAPADYNIEIPMLVRDRIAKSVRVRVAFSGSPTGGSTVPLSSSAPTH
jgi:polyisoprenoid-binding protein YceI